MQDSEEPNFLTSQRKLDQPNVYVTPEKYKNNAQHPSFAQHPQQPSFAQHPQQPSFANNAIQDPFIQYPTTAQHATKYRVDNIQNLSETDIQYLQQKHPTIYKKLQRYLMTIHSAQFNHCFKILSPNTSKIQVQILYIFYTYFIHIL